MSGMVEHNAGMVRERLARAAGTPSSRCPRRCSEVVAKLDEPDGPSVLPLSSPADRRRCSWSPGWSERLYHRALRNYRRRLAPAPSETFTARAFRRGVGLALDLVGIVVFALAALAYLPRALAGARPAAHRDRRDPDRRRRRANRLARSPASCWPSGRGGRAPAAVRRRAGADNCAGSRSSRHRSGPSPADSRSIFAQRAGVSRPTIDLVMPLFSRSSDSRSSCGRYGRCARRSPR